MAVTERLTPARERLLQALSPELVEAVEQLVGDAVQQALNGATPASVSPWLALAEAAAYFRVSERTLERLIAKRRVRSTTLGRRRLLHRDALDVIAAAGEETAPTAPPRRREVVE